MHKLVWFVPREALEVTRDAVFAAGAGRIGKYERCSWYTAGTGTFLAGKGTDPSIGQVGREERVSELMRALWERFPDYPPYGGEINDPLPHVTLAESGEDESAAELAAAIRARTKSLFPLSCEVRDVALLEEHEPDRWRERRRFPLGRNAAA